MVNGNNGNRPYIQSLLVPSAGGATRRMSWGVDVEAVWVPFFTASNAMGDSQVSPESLGAPIRLAVDKEGTPRFGANGRPSMRVAQEITQQIRTVRENFVASLQVYTATAMEEIGDAYEAQVKLNQEAGTPLVAQDAKLLADHEEREAALLAAAEPCLEDMEAAEASPAPTGRRSRTAAPEAEAAEAPALEEATA